jgi:isopropylmalate/homocitrate/citramalate synthase
LRFGRPNRQAEFFVYRKQDLDGFRIAQERHAAGAPIEPTTWIRAAVKDVKLIQSLGVRESGLLASISDFHVFHKFHPGGRMQAAQIYLDAVQLAFDAGIRPRLHLEDASRASIDFIRYFVRAVLAKAALYPDSLRPKFRICDTLGVALPDDDAPLPRGVPKLFQSLRSEGLRPLTLSFTHTTIPG